jgi:small basic protein
MMIILPLLAVFLGFALFYSSARSFEADEALARYMAIAVLAGLDTVLGGLRARLGNNFDDLVFVSGFFINALLAASMVALGEKFGLETGFGDQRISVMMIAAVVVFSTRIFNNLAALRRMVIDNYRERRAAARHASTEKAAVESGSEQSLPSAASHRI